MSLKIRCACGTEITAEVNQIGDFVHCPGCNRLNEVDVPTAKAYPVAGIPPTAAPVAEITFDDEQDRPRKIRREDEPSERNSRRQKPDTDECIFCGEDDVKVVSFWTAIKGQKVRIYSGDESSNWPTYHNLVQHEVGVCRACMKKLWDKHTTILLWSGGAALFVGLIIAIWCVASLGSLKGKAQGGAVAIIFAFLGGAGAYGKFVFGLMANPKMDRKEVDHAVAHKVWKHVAPDDHDCGLSQFEYKCLRPQQFADEMEKINRRKQRD